MKISKKVKEWVMFMGAVVAIVVVGWFLLDWQNRVAKEADENEKRVTEQNAIELEKRFEDDSFQTEITVVGFKGTYTNVVDDLGANAVVWFKKEKTLQLKRGDKLKVTVTNDWKWVKTEDGKDYESTLP